MTNQEAIDILRADIGLDRQGITYCHDELGIEALDMAIKVLTGLDKIYAELERSMKDYETDLVHFIPLLCVKEMLDKYTNGESEDKK